jgi:hypothetical protein
MSRQQGLAPTAVRLRASSREQTRNDTREEPCAELHS